MAKVPINRVKDIIEKKSVKKGSGKNAIGSLGPRAGDTCKYPKGMPSKDSRAKSSSSGTDGTGPRSPKK